LSWARVWSQSYQLGRQVEVLPEAPFLVGLRPFMLSPNPLD